jgi:hypothetical protein
MIDSTGAGIQWIASIGEILMMVDLGAGLFGGCVPVQMATAAARLSKSFQAWVWAETQHFADEFCSIGWDDWVVFNLDPKNLKVKKIKNNVVIVLNEMSA